ncbi:MAG: hypothetical protein RLN81_11545 [Balneolaceae bacterium]
MKLTYCLVLVGITLINCNEYIYTIDSNKENRRNNQVKQINRIYIISDVKNENAYVRALTDALINELSSEGIESNAVFISLPESTKKFRVPIEDIERYGADYVFIIDPRKGTYIEKYLSKIEIDCSLYDHNADKTIWKATIEIGSKTDLADIEYYFALKGAAKTITNKMIEDGILKAK